MSFDMGFTKDNLDVYLKELAKEFRRLNGKSMQAEIILIGGAAVVINYGFREMTYDMDAIINAASSMKDAIGRVGDKYDLPVGWMNADFMKTSSYTPNIVQYSRYYKTFANIVTFGTQVTGKDRRFMNLYPDDQSLRNGAQYSDYAIATYVPPRYDKKKRKR